MRLLIVLVILLALFGLTQSNFPNLQMVTRTLVYAWEYSKSAQAGDPHIQGQIQGKRYYHIRTPIGQRSSILYRFDLTGYSYGEGMPLDFTWVGYPYYKNGILYKSMAWNRSPRRVGVTQYFKDNLLHLKFGPINRYLNGFELHYQGRFYKHYKDGLKPEYSLTITKT